MLRGIYSCGERHGNGGSHTHEIVAENLRQRHDARLSPAGAAVRGPPPRRCTRAAAQPAGTLRRSSEAQLVIQARLLYTGCRSACNRPTIPMDCRRGGQCLLRPGWAERPALHAQRFLRAAARAAELQARGGGYRVRGQGGTHHHPCRRLRPSPSARDGTVSKPTARNIGRLRLANFARPETLRRVGHDAFSKGTIRRRPAPDSVRRSQQGLSGGLERAARSGNGRR
jgi:hypothetical protein